MGGFVGVHPDTLRRRDKEIGERAELDRILHAAAVLHLAMARDGEPYLVPLSFGYDGDRLYFHCAMDGLKLDFLAANPRVCFTVVEGPRLVEHERVACSFSAAYASVLGRGRAMELVDEASRRRGLDEIMRHYTGRGEWEYGTAVLARTRIWAVEIESLTGKRSPAEE